MGFFDFLFPHKNKEADLEERRRERQEEDKKQEEKRRKALEEGVLLSSLTEEEEEPDPEEEVADLVEDLDLLEKKKEDQDCESPKEEGLLDSKPDQEDQDKAPEEGPQEEAPGQEDLTDKPQAPIRFGDLALLREGESLDLPSSSKVQKLKVTKLAGEFYDLSFESKGFTYERKRIHQDILKNHLENYEKTGSMVLKSFRP